MTDRYQEIRDALAMGPTPGPWADGPLYSVVTQDYCAGKNPVIALVELIPAKLDECMANKSLICACDPDTIRALLAERDQLAAALEAAREDAERLDSGTIRIIERDEFGMQHTTAYSGVDLRAAIDQARGKGVADA